MRLFIVCMMFPIVLCAQQQGQNNAVQPIDLQEFVITGKASAEIKGGIKQKPLKPQSLKQTELDSINTNEKIPAPLLSALTLPKSTFKKNTSSASVQAEVGQFYTPKIIGLYTFEELGYSVDALGYYEGSKGHIQNADYSKLKLAINASYDAPKKFIFFGGSRTESSFSAFRNGYSFFGMDSAIDRSIMGVKAHAHTKGNVQEYTYSTGAEWNLLQCETNMKHTNDSRIMGFLDVSRPIGTMNYGAKASVDLHSFRENSSYNMIQIGGYTKFIYEDIQSDISVDLQSATNSRDITLGGVLITYNAQYQINEDITLFGFLQSGLIANSFQDMVQNNPYIIDSSVISFRRDMIHVKPSFMYQPTAKLSIQTAIDYRISSEMPVYIPNSLERNNYSGYAIEYVGANIVTLSSELLWKPNNDMSFSGLFAFTNSQLSDFDGGVPLLPSLKAGAKWDMKWNNDIQSIFSAEYIGERSIDKQSTISLPAYIMVNLQCNYALPYNMQGYIRLDNILNSKVYLWNGFQERGIFIALGLKYSL